MARDNKHLGCRKLYGYLKYLGLKVSSATISRVLREHGIEPSPKRPERTSWNEFIKAHWESLAAIDFFTKEIHTVRGLVRYMVLVVIDYKTRKVEIAGIIPQADGRWMKQIGAPSKAYVNQLDNPARLKANHRAGTELCV